MNIVIHDRVKGYDHTSFSYGERGNGFISGSGVALTRCGRCNLENYAMAVLSGTCAFCGHSATDIIMEVIKSYGKKEKSHV